MPTVKDVLTDFRSRNNLDPRSSHASQWGLQFGLISIRLPNFRWRKQAILKHDLHHLITGYPCSIRGECQMATWEFAAGRYPHPAATIFCLPLVMLGLCLSPKAMWAAFRSGRRGRSLYRSGSDERLLAQEFHVCKTDALRARERGSHLGEVIRFIILSLSSALLTFGPLFLLWAFLA